MTEKSFRGVVLGSSWRFRVDNLVEIGPNREFSPPKESRSYQAQRWAAGELLRRSLFYFDKVVWPTNNALPEGIDPTVDLLVGEGEVERRAIEFAPMYPGQFEKLTAMINAFPDKAAVGTAGADGMLAREIARFHRNVYDRLENQQPGAWNYSVVGNGIEFEKAKTVRGYSMDLYDCLPAPTTEASYESIIAFKKREKAALVELRGNLGEMYTRIAKSDDKPFVALEEAQKIETSVVAVERLLPKSQIQHLRQSLSIELKGGNLKAALGTLGTSLFTAVAMKHVLPAVAGVAAGVWCVVKIKDIQSPSTSAGAFKYIYKAGRDKIVDLVAPNESAR